MNGTAVAKVFLSRCCTGVLKTSSSPTMRCHPIALFTIILSSLTTNAGAYSSLSRTLHFDGLSPPPLSPGPIYALPRLYHHLHFTAFSVFDPESAALSHIIIPEDKNCAASKPNALLGSRLGGEDGLKAGFEIVSTKGSDGADGNGVEVAKEDWTCFDLVGMSMKPMAAPPGDEEITVWAKGYKALRTNEDIEQVSTDEDTVLWHVDIPVGYHLRFNASFPEEWNRLWKVEMWADYGPDGLDWEFCVDDLEVVFGSQDNCGTDSTNSRSWEKQEVYLGEGGKEQSFDEL